MNQPTTKTTYYNQNGGLYGSPFYYVMKNKFSIGQQVYVISDPDQNVWFVIGIYYTAKEVTYTLRTSHRQDTFYDFEISTDKTFI